MFQVEEPHRVGSSVLSTRSVLVRLTYFEQSPSSSACRGDLNEKQDYPADDSPAIHYKSSDYYKKHSLPNLLLWYIRVSSAHVLALQMLPISTQRNVDISSSHSRLWTTTSHEWKKPVAWGTFLKKDSAQKERKSVYHLSQPLFVSLAVPVSSLDSGV